MTRRGRAALLACAYASALATVLLGGWGFAVLAVVLFCALAADGEWPGDGF